MIKIQIRMIDKTSENEAEYGSNFADTIITLGVLGCIILSFLPLFVTIPSEYQFGYDIAFYVCLIITCVAGAILLCAFLLISLLLTFIFRDLNKKT